MIAILIFWGGGDKSGKGKGHVIRNSPPGAGISKANHTPQLKVVVILPWTRKVSQY